MKSSEFLLCIHLGEEFGVLVWSVVQCASVCMMVMETS